MGERQTALERAALTVRGVRGQLQVADGKVRIERDGDAATPGTAVEVPLTEIRGTTLSAPGVSSRGWIHLAVVGGTPTPTGDMAAMSDPYVLPLTVRGLAGARKLVKLVERHLQQRGLPPDQPRATQRRPSSSVIPRPSPAPTQTASTPTATVEPETTIVLPDVPERKGTAGRAEFVEELRTLAELHAAGALTDDEFSRAKRKLLG